MNGESFENLTHHEAVAVIKRHKKSAACLRVLVARQRSTKSRQRLHSLIFTRDALCPKRVLAIVRVFLSVRLSHDAVPIQAKVR